MLTHINLIENKKKVKKGHRKYLYFNYNFLFPMIYSALISNDGKTVKIRKKLKYVGLKFLKKSLKRQAVGWRCKLNINSLMQFFNSSPVAYCY